MNQAPVDVPGVASAESAPGRRLAIVVGTALEAAVAGAGCHAAALA